MAIASCDGCKFWSERLAKATGGGPVEAMCLNDRSPNRMQYVYRGCDCYSPGRAVDDPAPIASEIED